jgi:uncharacterized protein (DUF433 family)
MPQTEDQLAIRNYDRQSGVAIAAKLAGVSQRDLRAIREYEAEGENRPVVMRRIAELSAEEPWADYDALNAEAIAAILAHADDATVRRVLRYEREHKARAAVIRAAG